MKVVASERGPAAFALVLPVALAAGGCGPPAQPLAIASSHSAPAASAAAPDFFAAGVAQGRPTIVEFGASACASCKEMKVVLDELRRTHGTQIGIAEVDLIKQREVIPRYRIQVMPTQIFFDGQGHETGRHIGVIDGAAILARLGVTPQVR
jgi:thioredoxin 1